MLTINIHSQYTQRFLLVRHDEIDVPEYLVGAYRKYRSNKRDYPKLLWPGEIEVWPLGRILTERLGITTDATDPDSQAVIFSPNLRDREKRIEVNISDQTLTAYEGTSPVLRTLISTGSDGFNTPSGNYSVLQKIDVMEYISPFPRTRDYRVPDVPFNLRVRWEGEFIHGTYWHDRFGNRTSAGCINLNNDDAKWVYDWARVRTPVIIRR